MVTLKWFASFCLFPVLPRYLEYLTTLVISIFPDSLLLAGDDEFFSLLGNLPLNTAVDKVVNAVLMEEWSMFIAQKENEKNAKQSTLRKEKENDEDKDKNSFKGENMLEDVPFKGEIKKRFMIVEMLLNAGADLSRYLRDETSSIPPLHSCLRLASPSPNHDLYPIPNSGYIQVWYSLVSPPSLPLFSLLSRSLFLRFSSPPLALSTSSLPLFLIESSLQSNALANSLFRKCSSISG